jgi:hypothetical protein
MLCCEHKILPIQILPIKVHHPSPFFLFNSSHIDIRDSVCANQSIFLLVTSSQPVLFVDIRKLAKLRLICKPCFAKSEVARGSLLLLSALLPCIHTDTLGRRKKREAERKRGERQKIVWQWRQLSKNPLSHRNK